MNRSRSPSRHGSAFTRVLVALTLPFVAALALAWSFFNGSSSPTKTQSTHDAKSSANLADSSIRPRFEVDGVGFVYVQKAVERWDPNSSPVEIAKVWDRIGYRTAERIDRQMAAKATAGEMDRYSALYTKASLMNYEGEPKIAYSLLSEARAIVESNEEWKRDMLYNLIFLQGITALRRGENENCIMCRGESSCILPIVNAAIHTNPEGSRLAIQRFSEYLAQFPDDFEVRWLLNLAHMTLGEHPAKVDSRFLISLDHYVNSEFDIGRFRDIGDLVGVNRFNQSGGAIMDDFDNDGRLDIVVTTFDPTGEIGFYHNTGEGTFENRTKSSGLEGQLGGLNCVQTDYNNDGRLDILIVRGAWVAHPMRPSLLRNDGGGKFTDVTAEAGLFDPVNSISASWSDYDNDGWLDLFICCERQSSRLYHNLGNGAFEEVGFQAGVCSSEMPGCKGAAWIDYDRDGFPDLFQNYLLPTFGSRLYHNLGNGTFEDVTGPLGIDGPVWGFSCWTWDYDNDGWQDLFATCFERNLKDAVKGMLGEQRDKRAGRLYHNKEGKRFEDVTREAGLDLIFLAMGSNFADFDNDGFLDIFLGTGDPNIESLVPDRMLKNVGGKRFADISATSGTGHLQKGHGVACGDWDRDGNTDIFIEMGGAVNGDKYHNVLFQNPGHNNSWLTIKLTGVKSNRVAIGARIKIVTDGSPLQTVYRHVSSGSSFGANPLQQSIGLGNAKTITRLEIFWPTSGATQVFENVAVNQAISIAEFAMDYQKLDSPPLPVPSRRQHQQATTSKN